MTSSYKVAPLLRRYRPALLALAVVCVPLAAAQSTSPVAPQTSARVAPGPTCMDAKGLLEMNQVNPGSISLLAADQSAWRLNFASACPGVLDAAQPRVVATDSWVCGGGQERVLADDRSCTVASVERISRREFSQDARQTTRSPIPTLESVSVTQTRRTFRGSPSYCFSTRDVRGWNENSRGITVETNPRRAGGHRYYVVEVGTLCRSLVNSPQLRFHSGFNSGVICGNPGDRVEILPIIDPSIEALSDGPAKSNLASMSINRVADRCDILAVYPDS